MIPEDIFGQGTDLSAGHMAIRAVLVFITALVLLRLAGRRAFGMGATFDNVIGMLLGAVLSRAVTGASPLLPTIVASFVIILLYRTCAWLSLKSDTFGRIVKGKAELIYDRGSINKPTMDRCLVTERDLLERVRHEAHVESIHEIDKAYLERDGAISIIKNTSHEI